MVSSTMADGEVTPGSCKYNSFTYIVEAKTKSLLFIAFYGFTQRSSALQSSDIQIEPSLVQSYSVAATGNAQEDCIFSQEAIQNSTSTGNPTSEWHDRNPKEYSRGRNYPDPCPTLLPWPSNNPPSTTEIATPVQIPSFSCEQLLELSPPMNTSPDSRSTAQPFGLASPMHTPTQDLEYIYEKHRAALCDIEKERQLRRETEAMLQRQTELHRQSTLQYEHKLQQAKNYLEAQQYMHWAFQRGVLNAKSLQKKRKTTLQVIEAEHEQLKKEHEKLKMAYQELQNAHQECGNPSKDSKSDV